MYFVDSQRTLTRRDSSLLTPKYDMAFDETAEDILTPFGAQSINFLHNESVYSFIYHKEPAQKEIVTILYDSLLKYIVESWQVIKEPKRDTVENMALKTQSLISHHKRKKGSGDNKGKSAKSKRIRSRQDFSDMPQLSSVSHSMIQTWKTFPDERATIRFKNGNIFEGSIAMRCMHGEGRLQWANGTIYIGKFKENTISGRGKIFWNDDTWYEGEFQDNVRHGRGLFVDSRKQICYYGDWVRGVKQGNGVMYYDGTFQNYYDGDWDNNLRHGYGCRQYSASSGYKGYWHKDVRDGEGLMIWLNRDVYNGQWDNGDISGKGTYIWEADFNNSIALASVVSYNGEWKLGQRCGYGLLELGLDGARYEGEFVNNKKHGSGMFVTNSGKVLQDKHLFVDDNFGSMENMICETTVDMLCHVKQVIRKIKDDDKPRNIIINSYFRMNKIKVNSEFKSPRIDLNNIMNKEEDALKKAVDNYWKHMQNIYFIYANINNDNICFKPVLIRLYLWKLYYDCGLNEKEVTLAEIDNMFHANRSWLSKLAHDPFEKIFFWQFIHSLVTVALKIYPVKCLSETQHDMIGKSFRKFMENDMLPRIGEHKGVVTSAYLRVLPLQFIYKLFISLGDPVTLLSFLRAIRYPAHDSDRQPPLVDAEAYIRGHNLYGLENTLQFIADENAPPIERPMNAQNNDCKLFNFGNLSSTTIIKNIFSVIFPQVVKEKILNLNIEITFYEFLELILLCANASIQVKSKEVIIYESPPSSIRPNKIK